MLRQHAGESVCGTELDLTVDKRLKRKECFSYRLCYMLINCRRRRRRPTRKLRASWPCDGVTKPQSGGDATENASKVYVSKRVTLLEVDWQSVKGKKLSLILFLYLKSELFSQIL